MRSLQPIPAALQEEHVLRFPDKEANRDVPAPGQVRDWGLPDPFGRLGGGPEDLPQAVGHDPVLAGFEGHGTQAEFVPVPGSVRLDGRVPGEQQVV